MGKTLKYKKRRKNTRRYKQKRRKTTRKSKRKYQITKKQKGGLCCRYENDSLGCKKGYLFGEENISVTDPISGPAADFKGIMFEPIRFTIPNISSGWGGDDWNTTAFKIGGVDIGFTHHSLKHMEALGIQCYDITSFSTLIYTMIKRSIWIYITSKNVDSAIQDHRNSDEALAKTLPCRGKTK